MREKSELLELFKEARLENWEWMRPTYNFIGYGINSWALVKG